MGAAYERVLVRVLGPRRVHEARLRPELDRTQNTGPSPGRPGQTGSKIHAMTDRGGIPLSVLNSAANTNDHLVLDTLVDSVAPVRQPRG